MTAFGCGLGLEFEALVGDEFLLAVTTLLPAARALRTQSPAGVRPPASSTITSECRGGGEERVGVFVQVTELGIQSTRLRLLGD